MVLISVIDFLKVMGLEKHQFFDFVEFFQIQAEGLKIRIK